MTWLRSISNFEEGHPGRWSKDLPPTTQENLQLDEYLAPCGTGSLCSQTSMPSPGFESDPTTSLTTIPSRQHIIIYTRAFGDGPRNFETWSSDVDDTSAGTPLLTTIPHQREDVSALDRFNVHRCPTRRVFSGTGIELMTCLPWGRSILLNPCPLRTGEAFLYSLEDNTNLSPVPIRHRSERFPLPPSPFLFIYQKEPPMARDVIDSSRNGTQRLSLVCFSNINEMGLFWMVVHQSEGARGNEVKQIVIALIIGKKCVRKNAEWSDMRTLNNILGPESDVLFLQ
ncbi:hypothetical protein TNCV_4279211 [Trichonephila clavipes]|nr:hypothetical protein TNCV_4279211 [Trichonephila clavipes]